LTKNRRLVSKKPVTFKEAPTKELFLLKENEKQELTGNEHLETNKKCLFPIIGRYHTMYMIWLFVLKSYFAFVVTYRLAFENIDKTRKEKDMWVAIDFIMDFSFLIDIVITFNKPYYDENSLLVTDRKQIANNYLASWFFVDLLMLVPMSYFKYKSRDMNSFTKRDGTSDE
jgi:hypothetical protein